MGGCNAMQCNATATATRLIKAPSSSSSILLLHRFMFNSSSGRDIGSGSTSRDHSNLLLHYITLLHLRRKMGVDRYRLS